MERLSTLFDLGFNTWLVIAGTVLMGISTSLAGCFTYLRKHTLLGDAIAHSILPGICIAFLIYEEKNTAVLFAGACVGGAFSVWVVEYLAKSGKIKEDTVIAIVLSVFFGFGIWLLTLIQERGNASQSGLDKFLFGQTASLMPEDIAVFAGVSLLMLSLIFLQFRHLKLITFDEQFANVSGFNTGLLKFILSSLTILAIVTGIQSVGVVLMSAMLITPAVSARYWTDDLSKMLILAAVFGMLSSLTGTFISLIDSALPTGPFIVLVATFIAIASFFFAPQKGILFKLRERKRFKIKILKENVLKAFYHLAEEDGKLNEPRKEISILRKRLMTGADLETGLENLKNEKLITKTSVGWQLTESGLDEAKRITRLHRLWELYLSTYLNLPPDHVHDSAETIEHIISPEIEEILLQQLSHPEQDSHGSLIPK